MGAWSIPLQGTIERRLLINFRVDPDVARQLVPSGLRPRLVNGFAVAGICMIRLGALRPIGMPARVGWRGENAAHRIAVEWDEHDRVSSGVYIPIRHSGSRLPVFIGGRLFPGVHQRAQFTVDETLHHSKLTLTSDATRVDAAVEDTDAWSSELFSTLDEASEFFRDGATGWSPTRQRSSLEGLHLRTRDWRVTPMRAHRVVSSYFNALPRGTATLDNVLVMRNTESTWTTPSFPPPHTSLAPQFDHDQEMIVSPSPRQAERR